MNKMIVGVMIGSMALSSLAQSTLDSDEVIRLLRSGMSEDKIVKIVNSQPGNYVVTAEEFGALREAGASDRVIAAMMRQSANLSRPAATAVYSHVTQAKYETASVPESPSSYQGQPPSYPVRTLSSSGASHLVVRDGTPVRLRLNRSLSSENVQVGDKVDFDVMDDIRTNQDVVIPRGTKAIGVIVEAEHKRRMGRAGKLGLSLEYVTLGDGTKVALRASHETRGGSHGGAVTAGVVATAMLVSLPAAPLFLLIHGKAAVMPEASEITAYVDGDVQLPAHQLSELR